MNGARCIPSQCSCAIRVLPKGFTRYYGTTSYPIIQRAPERWYFDIISKWANLYLCHIYDKHDNLLHYKILLKDANRRGDRQNLSFAWTINTVFGRVYTKLRTNILSPNIQARRLYTVKCYITYVDLPTIRYVVPTVWLEIIRGLHWEYVGRQTYISSGFTSTEDRPINTSNYKRYKQRTTRAQQFLKYLIWY